MECSKHNRLAVQKENEGCKVVGRCVVLQNKLKWEGGSGKGHEGGRRFCDCARLKKMETRSTNCKSIFIPTASKGQQPVPP